MAIFEGVGPWPLARDLAQALVGSRVLHVREWFLF